MGTPGSEIALAIDHAMDANTRSYECREKVAKMLYSCIAHSHAYLLLSAIVARALHARLVSLVVAIGGGRTGRAPASSGASTAEVIVVVVGGRAIVAVALPLA